MLVAMLDSTRPVRYSETLSGEGVGSRHAFGCIDHQQRNVGGFQMPARHHHRELFGHQLCLALAANPGRVDEAEIVILVTDHLVDRIARGAGHRRNNRAGAAGKGIQQRGLAHVGPPDDGHPRFSGEGLHWHFRAVGKVRRRGQFRCRRRVRVDRQFRVCLDGRLGQNSENLIQQIADAVPMLGRNGDEVANAEPP